MAMKQRAHLVTLALAVTLWAPAPARAWKPVTHVHLAQQAWDDALDGKVTIELIDPATGARSRLGEFEVDPEVVAAFRNFPAAYFAGVIGPDGYPDLITGQMRVHPPGEGQPGDPDLNVDGAGTEPWLRHLWRRARVERHNQAALAFTYGYLAHAAGDYFAHTYVNRRTGGIFQLGLNGLKHMMLEGYLEQRTPALAKIGGRDPYDAFLREGMPPALADFIARNTIDIPGGLATEGGRATSLPAIYADMTRPAREALAAYDRAEATLLAHLGPLGQELAFAHRTLAWACDLTRNTPCPVDGASPATCPAPYAGMRGNPGACLAVGLYLATIEGPVVATLAPWHALVATAGPAAMIVRRWVHNVDEGLVKWVETNHRFTYWMAFNPGGMKVAEAMKAWSDFAPVAAGMVAGIDGDVIRRLQEAVGVAERPMRRIEAVRSELHTRAFTLLFGVSPDDLATRYASPHATIDTLFGVGARAAVNRDLGLPVAADDDFADYPRQAITRFDWRRFGPMYNTVVLTKLSLLGEKGLRDFHQAIAARVGVPLPAFDRDNIMFGWGETIDGSNQWSLDMPLAAHGCAAWKRLFVVAPEPTAGRGHLHPGEPDDVCAPAATVVSPAPPPPAPVRVAPVFVQVDAGARVTLTASREVGFRVSHGAIAAGCTAPAGQPCTVTYVVPPVTEDTDILVEAYDRAEPRRRAVAVVSARAPLTVRAAPALASGGLDPLVAGGTVAAGTRVVLTTSPAIPVRWSLVGPGRLGDRHEALALSTRLASQQARLDRVGRSFAQERAARLLCKPGATCRAPAPAAIAGRETEVQQAHDEVARTREELAVLERTYIAPDRVTGPEPVRIRVEAADGRSAELALTVRPPPPALSASAARVVAGGTIELEVSPPVPVEWTVVDGGVGTVGVPVAERARLMPSLDDLARRMPPPRLAPVPRGVRPPSPPSPVAPTGQVAPPSPVAPAGQVTPPIAPTGQVAPPVAPAGKATPPVAPTGKAAPPLAPPVTLPFTVEQFVGADRQQVHEPVAAAARARSTYRAPATVDRPTVVTLRGVARDGTGRAVTTTVTITPR